MLHNAMFDVLSKKIQKILHLLSFIKKESQNFFSGEKSILKLFFLFRDESASFFFLPSLIGLQHMALHPLPSLILVVEHKADGF